MSSTPTLSVIVACKNPGSRFPAALASVWEQRHVSTELIVIDGASTDGTAAWLQARRDRIATLISEPDAGLYFALNKGIAHARGEWIYFLDAHARLAGEMVLSETVNWMRKSEAGVVAGEAAYDDGHIHRLRSRPNAIARNFVHHQAAFYRRTLFAENGDFDTSLRVMADYDFHLRIWKSRVRFKPLPLRIAACGVDLSTKTDGWTRAREEIAVRHRYFSVARSLPWDALSLLRALRPAGARSRAAHQTDASSARIRR